MACHSGQCAVSMNFWLLCAEYDKPSTEYDCVASMHIKRLYGQYAVSMTVCKHG